MKGVEGGEEKKGMGGRGRGNSMGSRVWESIVFNRQNHHLINQKSSSSSSRFNSDSFYSNRCSYLFDISINNPNPLVRFFI